MLLSHIPPSPLGLRAFILQSVCGTIGSLVSSLIPIVPLRAVGRVPDGGGRAGQQPAAFGQQDANAHPIEESIQSLMVSVVNYDLCLLTFVV